MEGPSPFIHHFDTNFIPTSSEVDDIQRLMDGRRAMLEATDAQITELQRCRETHAHYIKKHGDLISPARRLPSDILLSIFMMLIGISDDRPPSHPAVTVSHVCRQWRVLALDSALLWVDIDIRIPSYPNWHLRGVPSHVPLEDEDEYFRGLIGEWQLRVSRLTERIKAFLKRSKGCPLQVPFTARDPAGFEQLANPSVLGSVSGWEQVLIPMTCMRSTRDRQQMENPCLDLKMCPIATLLLGPVRLALDGRLEGLESQELDFSYHGTKPLTARMWEALLPSGIDLGRIPLTSLTTAINHQT